MEAFGDNSALTSSPGRQKDRNRQSIGGRDPEDRRRIRKVSSPKGRTLARTPTWPLLTTHVRSRERATRASGAKASAVGQIPALYAALGVSSAAISLPTDAVGHRRRSEPLTIPKPPGVVNMHPFRAVRMMPTHSRAAEPCPSIGLLAFNYSPVRTSNGFFPRLERRLSSVSRTPRVSTSTVRLASPSFTGQARGYRHIVRMCWQTITCTITSTPVTRRR